MTEDDFWLALEFRLCSEFSGMAERPLRYLWCDGITPIDRLLEEEPPKIVGRAWICDDRKQERWDFTLFLPSSMSSTDSIDWGSLLPAEDVTRWLAVDRDRKRIEIEPAAAVPDLA
jgi:hypothetical protein